MHNLYLLTLTLTLTLSLALPTPSQIPTSIQPCGVSKQSSSLLPSFNPTPSNPKTPEGNLHNLNDNPPNNKIQLRARKRNLILLRPTLQLRVEGLLKTGL